MLFQLFLFIFIRSIKMGRTEVVVSVLKGRNQKQIVGVALNMVVMGGSWAVFLAQEALVGGRVAETER